MQYVGAFLLSVASVMRLFDIGVRRISPPFHAHQRDVRRPARAGARSRRGLAVDHAVDAVAAGLRDPLRH
jgi:hypothetical protein